MLCILNSRDEIRSARGMLAKRGLNVLPTRFGNLLRFLGLSREIAVGDTVKGWDVLKTVDFVDGNLGKNAAILDIGAFASEILPLLKRIGYTNLTGIDLNPRIVAMPSADIIRYDVGNFLASPYPSGSLNAITAISVIEHGYDGERLFREISRLLAPGGYFIASFDYWPEKIESGDIRPFDLSWIIFSRDDVKELIAQAVAYGLEPVGAIDFHSQDATIEWQDRKYTFAWIALRKVLS